MSFDLEESMSEEQGTVGGTDEAREGMAEKPSAPPSRFGLFMRNVLKWAAGLVLVFGLGVAAMWIVRVKPQTDQIAVLQSQIDGLQQQVDSLTTEVEGLRPLKQKNADLQDQLTLAEEHLQVLQVLVDVISAQVQMGLGEPAAARQALSGTDGRLQTLQSKLQADQQKEVQSMRDRLALVLGEVDTNNFAAVNDLEVLAGDLAAFERATFGP
jgi:cell division protein FtsB